MTTSSAGVPEHAVHSTLSVDELFRNVPVQTFDDLACPGIFDTDQEVDEFIEHVYSSRRADPA
jgi:hypothetical protein